MALPFDPSTRIAKKTPLQNAGMALGTAPAAKPPTDYTGQINQQYDAAQSRLGVAQQNAGASALENAQRGAAIRGTSGAGFETKIQQQAVNESAKPYLDQATGLASDRAGALTAAGQAGDTMKENQRQFDISAGLQRFVASNEMDLNKFSTFINASTALNSAGLNSPQAWQQLFQGGVFGGQLGNAGIKTPNIAQNNSTAATNNQNYVNNARSNWQNGQSPFSTPWRG